MGYAPRVLARRLRAALVGLVAGAALLPVTTVSLPLLLTPTVMLSTATATAGADGHAVYSLSVPPGRLGPVVVRATGTNTVGQPFAISTSGTLVECPAGLPATGSSG